MTGVGGKEGAGGGEKAETEFLHFRLLICGSELKVERRGEERKRKGFRTEGGRDNGRVTGEGEGREKKHLG